MAANTAAALITKYWQTYKSMLVGKMGNWFGTSDNPIYVTTASAFPVQTTPQKKQSLGYKQIQDLSAAHQLGETNGVQIPTGALEAIVTAYGGTVNFVENASDPAPTASVGMPLLPGQPYRINAADLPNFKMIAVDVGAGVNITFYGAAP